MKEVILVDKKQSFSKKMEMWKYPYYRKAQTELLLNKVKYPIGSEVRTKIDHVKKMCELYKKDDYHAFLDHIVAGKVVEVRPRTSGITLLIDDIRGEQTGCMHTFIEKGKFEEEYANEVNKLMNEAMIASAPFAKGEKVHFKKEFLKDKLLQKTPLVAEVAEVDYSLITKSFHITIMDETGKKYSSYSAEDFNKGEPNQSYKAEISKIKREMAKNHNVIYDKNNKKNSIANARNANTQKLGSGNQPRKTQNYIK